MKTHDGDNGRRSEAEITKIQELMYELRVDEIMTIPVITIGPTSPMKQARDLMRSHRISGLPVVDGESLVGIVSVEDVFRWLEQGANDTSVFHWMTKQVLTVRGDGAAVQAINKFGTYRVGRLPVLDRQGKLVGIVTPGDIIDRVLRVLDTLYREEEAYRPAGGRCTLDDLLSDGTTLILRYDIPPGDLTKAGTAATRIKRILEGFRIDPQVVRRAGTAAYEAEINLAIHTQRGGRLLAQIRPKRLLIEAVDDGPGIKDLSQALTPGYSTAADWIRELGFGAGMGLTNMKNCSDHFVIKSEAGKGTTVRISIDLDMKKGN